MPLPLPPLPLPPLAAGGGAAGGAAPVRSWSSVLASFFAASSSSFRARSAACLSFSAAIEKTRSCHERTAETTHNRAIGAAETQREAEKGPAVAHSPVCKSNSVV